MRRLARLLPRTIRRQIMAIIVLAVLLVILMGRVLEAFGEDIIKATDLEALSGQMGAVARLVQQAPPAERDMLFAAMTRAGYGFEVVPQAPVDALPSPSFRRSAVAWFVDIVFPSGDTHQDQTRPGRRALRHGP